MDKTDNSINFFEEIFDPMEEITAECQSIDSFQTKTVSKLLPVIFVIDCSRSMEHGSIQAINDALRELKQDFNRLKKDTGADVKIAVLGFTSSARWQVPLCAVDEAVLDEIHTRPGLTAYGTAFRELNKVLSTDGYLQYSGKLAEPVIMFLTDGAPTDDYRRDLDALLQNPCFVKANRSAVLIGNAIHSEDAVQAVLRFANDRSHVISVDKTADMVGKIRLETIHNVADDGRKDKPEESPPVPKWEPVPDDLTDDLFGDLTKDTDALTDDGFTDVREPERTFRDVPAAPPIHEKKATTPEDILNMVLDLDDPFSEKGVPAGEPQLKTVDPAWFDDVPQPKSPSEKPQSITPSGSDKTELEWQELGYWNLDE